MAVSGVYITATIITLNEEKHITRCINSLKGIADEIIVVDSFSTDQTQYLCSKQDNIIFLQNKFSGHIEQKNYAIQQAKYNIILSVDADEVISPILRESILKIKENWQGDGYYFNRLTQYSDHWVRYCGWYPDRKLRLFDKNKGKWGGHNPHDIIVMNPETKTYPLKGDLLHYSYESISDHIGQTNKFTTIAAYSAYNRGARSSYFKILTRPPMKFFKDYILKQGFRDGRYGFIICVINGLSAFLKYTKLFELQKGKEIL